MIAKEKLKIIPALLAGIGVMVSLTAICCKAVDVQGKTTTTAPLIAKAQYVARAGQTDIYRYIDPQLHISCIIVDRQNGGTGIWCVPGLRGPSSE